MNKTLSSTLFLITLGTSAFAGGLSQPVTEMPAEPYFLNEEKVSSEKQTHTSYFVEMAQADANYTLNNMGVGDSLEDSVAGFGFAYGQTVHKMDKNAFYGWDVGVNFNGNDYQFPGDAFQSATYSMSASVEATGRIGKHMNARTSVYALAGASAGKYEVSVDVDNGVQQNSENYEGIAVSAILGAGVERQLDNGRFVYAELRRNEIMSLDLSENMDMSAGQTSLRLGYKINF